VTKVNSLISHLADFKDESFKATDCTDNQTHNNQQKCKTTKHRLIDPVEASRPIKHKMSHFEDMITSQTLA